MLQLRVFKANIMDKFTFICKGNMFMKIIILVWHDNKLDIINHYMKPSIQKGSMIDISLLHLKPFS